MTCFVNIQDIWGEYLYVAFLLGLGESQKTGGACLGENSPGVKNQLLDGLVAFVAGSSAFSGDVQKIVPLWVK